MTLESMMVLAGFLALCAGLVLLPLAPALREWRRPTDTGALTVPVSWSSRVSHFASELRADPGRIRDAADGHGAVPSMDGQAVHATQPVYCGGDYVAGAGSSFTELLSGGSIELGAGSSISQWAHCESVLRLGPGSLSLRRLSSSGCVVLGEGCCFERIHAPVIEFGTALAGAPLAPQPPGLRWSYAAAAGAERSSAVLHRVTGDCDIPAGVHCVGSLVVSGVLTIGSGSVVDGDVQARGGVLLAHAARVNGAVISERAVELGSGSRVAGPLVSEVGVVLSGSCEVGTCEAPTTISAPTVTAQRGAVAHGSVWAREAGTVWGHP